MSMFLGYAPWILFSLATSQYDWRVGLAVGLVSQIAVMLVTGRSRRIGALDLAMTAFFVVVGAFAVVQPESALETWGQPLATAWIAVVSLATIVVGRPFTLAYSEGDVTPEIAATDLFRSINTTIAWAWTAAFAVMAAASFVAITVDAAWISTLGTVLALIAAIKFTKQYPDRATARTLAPTDGSTARPQAAGAR
jgi:hypothetical protein